MGQRIARITALAASAAVVALTSLAETPRDLPSLVVRWRHPGPIDAQLLSGDRLYIAGGTTVTALDTHDGHELWKAEHLGDENSKLELSLAGDTLLVNEGNQVSLLHVNDGTRYATSRAEQIISPVLGDIAIDNVGDTHRLFRISLKDGSRQPEVVINEWIQNAVNVDGIIALIVTTRSEPRVQSFVQGYDAATLEKRWEIPIHDEYTIDFEKLGDRLCIHRGDSFLPLNLRDGSLGPPLPKKGETDVSMDLPWDLDVLSMSDDRTSSTIRRNNAADGAPVWTRKLPCTPKNTLMLGSTLFIDCERGGGRDLFLFLDWKTGVIQKQLYGLAEVDAIDDGGETLYVRTDEELVAISASESGPPESKLAGVRSEVHRILAKTSGDETAIGRGDPIRNRIAELETLGPPALPYIVEEIPSLGTTSLIAAAEVCIKADYKPAADSFAKRLGATLEQPKLGWPRWKPQYVLTDALAHLGNASHVPLLESIVSDSSRDEETRRKAFGALATLGAKHALRALIAEQRKKPHGVWSAPTIEPFASLIGKTPDKAALEKNLEEQFRWIQAAQALRLGPYVVFHESWITANDVWIVKAGDDGKQIGATAYLGSLPGIRGVRLDLDEPRALEGRITGNRVEVWLRGHSQTKLRARISDDDSREIPANVAELLGTGKFQAAAESDDAASAAINQFFMFMNSAAPAVIVSDTLHEWWGYRGSTITLPARDAEAMQQRLGYDGLPYVHLHEVSSNANTARFNLTIYRGPLSAVFYDISMKKLGDEWFMEDVELSGVS